MKYFISVLLVAPNGSALCLRGITGNSSLTAFVSFDLGMKYDPETLLKWHLHRFPLSSALKRTHFASSHVPYPLYFCFHGHICQPVRLNLSLFSLRQRIAALPSPSVIRHTRTNAGFLANFFLLFQMSFHYNVKFISYFVLWIATSESFQWERARAVWHVGNLIDDSKQNIFWLLILDSLSGASREHEAVFSHQGLICLSLVCH